MKRFLYIILILNLIAGFVLSCGKKDETIDPDAKYYFVADLVEYCKGSCDEVNTWEGGQVWVKGYIHNLSNESTLNTYYARGRFYLEDIRNGMLMDVAVVSQKDEIFAKIGSARATDRFYIKGVAVALFAYENTDCTKGMKLELSDVANIQINAE